MKLIKDKRVGKVLFIVEGNRYEFSLIKKIFCGVLGYKRIEKHRTKTTYYMSESDSHSVVAIINTKTSNIKSIDEKNYLESIFAELLVQYAFDVTNSAIYYIFDRDPESNTDSGFILNLIKLLKNSRENDDNMMGGMLILSYPAIEAYEISNFLDNSFRMEKKLGADLKKYIETHAKSIALNKINEETIVHAADELLACLKEQEIEFDIDEFAKVNNDVFNIEEEHFKNTDLYYVLSMMACVLLDLGILKEEDNNEKA